MHRQWPANVLNHFNSCSIATLLSVFHPELPVIPKPDRFKRLFIWKKAARDTAESQQQFTLLHDSMLFYFSFGTFSLNLQPKESNIVLGFFLFLDFCLMLQSMMGTFLLCKTILCYLETTKGTTCKNGMYLIHIGVFQCKKQYICKGMKYVYNRNTVIPKWKRV